MAGRLGDFQDPFVSNELAYAFTVDSGLSLQNLTDYYQQELPKLLSNEQRAAMMM